MRRLVLLLATMIIPGVAGDGNQPSPTVEDLLDQRLLRQLRAIDDSTPGVLGVALIDLTTGHRAEWHGDTAFPQASSIKIPILAELFHRVDNGSVNLLTAVKLEKSEAVGGSGHLKGLLRFRPLETTVEELATAMIETSDNTATNKLIALLGMDAVNARMDGLGLPNTRLHRIMMDTAAAARGDENVSTPLEMARLMELIYSGKAVSAASSAKMLDMMKLVEADFRASIPADIAVASKPGELTGVRCETGVVLLPGRPYVLSVMSTFLDDGANPIAQVVRSVHAHFVKLAASNRYGNRYR